MSSDLNRVIQIVRLVRDPEMRYTPSGTAVCSFSVVSNYSYGSGDNKKEKASFFDCVAWGKLGEIMAEYGKKGKRLAIEGRLDQRRWDDQDGKKRSKVEIVVENFQFLSAKQTEDETTGKAGEPDNPLDDKDATGKHPSWEEANPFSDDDMQF